MQQLNEMNFDDFCKNLISDTMPTINMIKPKHIYITKNHALKRPLLIRSFTCSFNTVEQKLFSMYINRHHLQYIPLHQFVKNFFLSFHTTEKGSLPNITTKLDELYNAPETFLKVEKIIRTMSNDSGATTNESSADSLPETEIDYDYKYF